MSALTLNGRSLLNRYATILTIISFFIVGLSGVFIFFHLGNSFLMGMHEWLGMAFVIAAVLHAVRHLQPFKKQLTHKRTVVLGAVFGLVALGFIATSLTKEGGNPARQLLDASMQAPIETLSLVVKKPAQTIIDDLKNAGIDVTGPHQSLDDLAQQLQRNPKEIMAIALKK